MNRENKITIKNLIYALLFLAFGIILLTSAEDLISIGSKVIGAVLIIVGVVKAIIYIYMKGKLGDYKLTELIVGLFLAGCGVLLLFTSSALSFVIRITMGLWILFASINKITFAIFMKKFDKVGFKMYLFSAIVMITVGVLITSGLLDKLIGLFIIIYSISEIADYIYYISRNREYNTDENTKTSRKLKINNKKIKNKKVIDAVIEEDTSKK